ncbi:hypothetical protein PENTCL1PPCAC_13407, partial [Pristionchus entomophagus]
ILQGDWTLNAKEMNGQCQWMGTAPFCWGDRERCPDRKFRHEIARASDAGLVTNNNTDPIFLDRKAFGGRCEDGERILCCKDSAFWIQEIVDVFLNTELNYLFPILLRKKNKYAGMRIRLIFAPGATAARRTEEAPPTTTTESTPTVPPEIPVSGRVEIEMPHDHQQSSDTDQGEHPDDDSAANKEKEKEGGAMKMEVETENTDDNAAPQPPDEPNPDDAAPNADANGGGDADGDAAVELLLL